jgi:hypothetical protein
MDEAYVHPRVAAMLRGIAERLAKAQQSGGATCSAVVMTLEAMHTHRDDALVLQHCCRALAGAAERGELPRDAAGATAVIDAVLMALGAHAADTYVVACVLRVLSSFGKPPCVPVVLQATVDRVMRATVAALRAHPGNADVQSQGCDLFFAWLGRSFDGHIMDCVYRDAMDALLDSGGVVVATAALRAHLHDTTVQVGACTVLGFVGGNANGRAAAITAGGLEAAVSVLELHGDALEERQACGMALCALLTEETADRAVAAGILPALAAALRSCMSSGLRVEYCRLLVFVAGAIRSGGVVKDGGALVVASGAVAAALGTLKLNAAEGAVILAAFDALRGLMSVDACVVLQAAAAGCLEATLAVLARPVLDGSVVVCAAALFALMTTVAAAATRAVKLGGIEALVAVMRKHAAEADWNLHITCCLSLHDMVKFDPTVNAAKAYRAGALPFVEACMPHCGDTTEERCCQRLLVALRQSVASADAAMAALLAEEEAARPTGRTTQAAAKGKGKGKSKKKGGKGGAAAAKARAVSRSRSRSASPDASPEEAGGGAAAPADAVPDAPDAAAAAAEAAAPADEPAAGGANSDAGGAGPSGSAPGCSAAAPPAAPQHRGAPRAYCPPMGPEGVPAAHAAAPAPLLPLLPPWLPPFQ